MVPDGLMVSNRKPSLRNTLSPGRPVPFRKLYPAVLVVQSSQDRNGEDGARTLDCSMQGRMTGGNEDDLLPLGERLLPGAALLSPRGQVLERGMPRFFRRLAEGVFDIDDLRRRTDELAEFVAAARDAYNLALPPIAVGFSNGANIAAALLLLRPGTIGGGCCCARWCRWCPIRCLRSGACRCRSTPGWRIRSSRPTRAKRWALCSGARGPMCRSTGSRPGTTSPRQDLEIGMRFLRWICERGSLNGPRSVFVLFRGCSAHRNGKTLPRSCGPPGVWRRPLSPPPAGAAVRPARRTEDLCDALNCP